MKYKISKYNLLINYSVKDYLLFNTYSTSMLKLPKDAYHEIKNKVQIDEFVFNNSDIILELFELGIIVPFELNESDIIKINNRQWRHDKKAYAIAIVPNIDCDFRCKYCFEDIESKYISEETIIKIERYFRKRISSNQINHLGVSWYGGEPLLSKNIISRLSKIFVQIKNYNAYLFTNGYDMDEDFIKNLANYGINLVHITVDGPRGVHDKYRIHKDGDETFNRIIENIKKIITYHNDSISINIRTNLDSNNKDFYGDLLETFKKIKSKKISFQVHKIQETLTGKGKSYCGELNDQETEIVYEYVRKKLLAHNFRRPEDFLPKNQNCHHCYVGLDNGFTINYDGLIYKCFGDINPPQNSIGSLNDDGDIDFNLLEYSRWYNYDYYENITCRNCILLPVCMGGCTHQRLGLTPNIPAKCDNSVSLKYVKKLIKQVYELKQ